MAQGVQGLRAALAQSCQVPLVTAQVKQPLGSAAANSWLESGLSIKHKTRR